MNNLIIAAVPLTMVEFIYPKCEEHIQKVVEKAPNEITVETVKERLLKGESQLVAILDKDEVVAVNVLQVSTMETGFKVLYIPITGGARMDEWLGRFMEIAHGIARDLECDELRGLACRKGWLRALKDEDWYPIHEVIGCKVKKLQEDSE